MTLKEFCENHGNDYIIVTFPNGVNDIDYGWNIANKEAAKYYEIIDIKHGYNNYGYVIKVGWNNNLI